MVDVDIIRPESDNKDGCSFTPNYIPNFKILYPLYKNNNPVG